jgi:hypothetical protein
MTHTCNGYIVFHTSICNYSQWLICTGYRGFGLGDFGTKGLDTFIEIHRCNELCKKLQFDEKFPLELIADISGPEPTEGSQSGNEMLNWDDAHDADNDAV